MSSSEGVLAIKALYTEQLYRADEWQRRAEVAEQMVSAFFTGIPSENSSLQEHILAQYGRSRKDTIKGQAALLSKEPSNG